MYHKGSLVKAGLIVLITLVLLAGGLVSLPPHYVAADDLPLKEGPPLPSGPEEEYVPDQIIVKFKEGIDTASEKQLIDSLGTEAVYTSPSAGFKVLQIPEGKTVAEMVALYSEQSVVEYAEPNYIDHITWSPDDEYYLLQWNFTHINMESAWDLDTTAPNYGGDPSIIVVVIDSGVAYETYDVYVQASDLANTNFWTNSGETTGNSVDDDGNGYVDDINGWDFVNSDAHPNDDNHHGTHVCGTIAQSTNNSTGVAGIAFNTTIMVLKTLDQDGSGTHANMADGFHYAADNGAHIINYSAGGSHSTTKENAVAYARNAGVIVIAAMGNTGDTTNTTEYPAAYDDYVIAVGATEYNQVRSYYSSYGSHCDIAAPGGDTSANHSGVGNDGIAQQTFQDKDHLTTWGYYLFQGTSMACPHVAGVAALILAKNPTWTPAQVRHALESNATDKGDVGRDDVYGWGLMNALAAVNSSLPTAASYKDTNDDQVPDTAEETFSDYETEHIVYICNTGLLPSHNYRVAYYDGGNDKRATEDDTSDSSGNLTTHHTFVAGTDAAGGWHVIVCDTAHTPPSTYNSTWAYTLGEDTFQVQESAIPEFPTVIAAIVSLSLCLGIYLWLRRKAVPMPA